MYGSCLIINMCMCGVCHGSEGAKAAGLMVMWDVGTDKKQGGDTPIDAVVRARGQET